VELSVMYNKQLPPTGMTRRKDSKPNESASLLMEEFRRASAKLRA